MFQLGNFEAFFGGVKPTKKLWRREWILGRCDSVGPRLGGMERMWYGSASFHAV